MTTEQQKTPQSRLLRFGRYGLLAGISFTILANGSLQAAEQVADPETQSTEIELEEIIVTGSHIRGAGVSVGSKVNIIDRAEIDVAGFSTVQQVLQSLPQNFQGGANEDTRLGSEAAANMAFGSTVNLRGLGATSTLVLINGRRLPVGGRDGNFVDVSNIPATAISRVEVLPDGASAIYGSDAVGGVVNIILREDFDGAETRMRYGGVTDGGLDEVQLAQTFGRSWNSGNLLLTFEYYNRDSLASAERSYTANSDLRPLGGDNQGSEVSNPGNILSPFTFAPAFAVPLGQDGRMLTPGDLLAEVNLGNQNEGQDLLPSQKRHSFFATLRQEVSEGVNIFAEGRFSERQSSRRFGGDARTILIPASNPFFVDPFGGSAFLFMNYSFLDDLGAIENDAQVRNYNGVLGSEVDLGRDWRVEVYGSYSRGTTRRDQFNVVDTTALALALADPDPVTAFNPFGDGSHSAAATIESIRSSNVRTSRSEVWQMNMVADGSLLSLSAGDVKLATGADYRKESFASGTARENDREVAALFAELFIPLFGKDHRRPGFEQLAVSLAGRVEEYSDVGRTANPRFGLLWTPVEGLDLRGSFGTSFTAPNLLDLDETFNQTSALPLADPASPSGSTFVVIQLGNNAALKNETSTSWTLGADYAPPFLPDLRLGLTYFNIDYKDRIQAPGDLTAILIEADKHAAIITRNPDAGEVSALCNSPSFIGNPVLCDLIPIGAIVDARLNNTSRTQVSGVDFTIDYGLDSEHAGRFDFKVNGSYLFHFREAFSPSVGFIDLVDRVNNVVDFKLRGSLSWRGEQGFAATGFVNYTDGYRDDVSSPPRGIDAWTTVDVNLSYHTADHLGSLGLNDMVFSLNVMNVFDTDPPFVNNPSGVGYDPANADPLGRFISFTVTKKW
ncbi:TonB-dependent receptor plug domain-containing protein [Paremcibacter congregatus]|uniref:TonB-dependent receptor plug domain-containing protein n=1 Tax=Paremcibacter congregatus TaxID=2043170 RepID=UPI0030EBBAA5